MKNFIITLILSCFIAATGSIMALDAIHQKQNASVVMLTQEASQACCNTPDITANVIKLNSAPVVFYAGSHSSLSPAGGGKGVDKHTWHLFPSAHAQNPNAGSIADDIDTVASTAIDVANQVPEPGSPFTSWWAFAIYALTAAVGLYFYFKKKYKSGG
jgi:hypothetical protein